MTERRATPSDLYVYAGYLRDMGSRGVYVYPGEPGVIRWSYKEPAGTPTFCIISPKGRLFLFVHEET
jgi:hypothetical protein